MGDARRILGASGPFATQIDSYQSRVGQLEVADAVERIMSDDGVLLCEAGTGMQDFCLLGSGFVEWAQGGYFDGHQGFARSNCRTRLTSCSKYFADRCPSGCHERFGQLSLSSPLQRVFLIA